MGRLRNLSSALTPLPGRVARQADAHGHDRSAEPWRKWYATRRWELLRRQVFVRDLYVCQMAACGQLAEPPVCDHVEPHRGDPALFWDPDNLQTLCKPCHDSAKQRAERAAPWG